MHVIFALLPYGPSLRSGFRPICVAALLAFAPVAALAGDGTMSLEAATTGTHHDAVISAALRLESEGAPYLSVEGRSLTSGQWVGRGTIGVDVLGRYDLIDVDLGFTLATGGQWREADFYAQPGLGFEAGLGVNLGRLHGQYRIVAPFGEENIKHVAREHRWRLGFDVLEDLQVFGEAMVLDEKVDATNWEAAGAYGIGAKLTF
jgi:hypothetical protein